MCCSVMHASTVYNHLHLYSPDLRLLLSRKKALRGRHSGRHALKESCHLHLSLLFLLQLLSIQQVPRSCGCSVLHTSTESRHNHSSPRYLHQLLSIQKLLRDWCLRLHRPTLYCHPYLSPLVQPQHLSIQRGLRD